MKAISKKSRITVSRASEYWRTQEMSLLELRLLMARELDASRKQICQTNMMESDFANVGLSLNIDGSEDHIMKFQGQKSGLPDSMKI